MSRVADHCRFVVGVDTHAATHTYALVESPSGKEVGTEAFPTTTAGLNRAAAWIGRRIGGDLDGVLVSAEGTGTYGAVLAEILTETGYRVVEAPAPSAKRLRGVGEIDTLDALTAARSTLVMKLDQLRDRRAGQLQTALKILTVAREQMNADRLRSINPDCAAAHARPRPLCPQSTDADSNQGRRGLATPRGAPRSIGRKGRHHPPRTPSAQPGSRTQAAYVMWQYRILWASSSTRC